ncbi:phosphate regulon sensor histidine kinase PhoR [Thiohalorhabdus denitrificans]|uniref:Phosphate regulon sensor protein PhoR n=1 Tax=Thiohalorhabdus denitrificans TaxID=381306 RepID=A0A1G5HU70_9GAMM|nr:phosphate regulon sensor histidine kinase PhoR [Thiohalorhabdus denitrificans]SCY67297.1 two-component system, OmpR family, phosphate regulon sensor histidine kinase PhoR [Thiohalorhabdus denitrificans]
MHLLPFLARAVIALGVLVATLGLLRWHAPLLALGLATIVAGGAAGWAWTRARLTALRRWLHAREGAVALPGENAWDTLESELRYYFKQRDRQLRETRRRLGQLEGLAQELPVGVALLDPQGRLVEANRKAYELLAVEPDRGHGQRLQGWLREPGLQHLFASEGPSLRQGTAPYHPDPSRTLAFTVTRKEDGTFLLVVEEITERLRLHRMREDFVANVSHELKSPLTSLRGFAETLLGDGELDPEQRDRFLRIMHEQIDRMQALVADLLTLSRLEGQPDPVPPTPVDLDRLLASLADQYAARATERGIRLDMPEPESVTGLHWYGEADALGQALANLIDNALKYTPEGGRVQVWAEERRGEVAVHVQDSGIGIDPQHLPRLTERFYRVDKGRSRAVGGTGLGLSIVKHILHHHGGRLEIDSAPGRGSTFSAVLPDHPPGGPVARPGTGGDSPV